MWACRRSLPRALRNVLGLTVFQLQLVAGPDSTVLESPIELEKPPSSWIRSYELRGWSGYKDNILLGNRFTIDSAIVGVGADFTAFRLPINGWEYSFITSADYTRYVDAPSAVDQEAIVIMQAQAKRSFGDGWTSGLAAEYTYFDQVFDSSAFEDVLVPLPIQGHSFTLRPSLTRALSKESRLELEFAGNRQIFDQFIDDFWDAGPKLSWIKQFGRTAEIGLSYQFNARFHDTREARTSTGLSESGQTLNFYMHDLAFAWRQYWDQARHWRTTTKLSMERNDDNGGGYYQFWRPQFSEQLRFQARGWEFRGEARLSYYDYDHQRVGGPASDLRAKAYLRLGVRAEKSITKSLKLFGQYEYEQALSNLAFDRYRVNTVTGGVDWEF
jgi:hypothetical protein